jgi:hypothetical protein
MGLGAELEIGVCGLVHFVSQTAFRSPVNIYVQVGQVSIAFGFHRKEWMVDAV